MELKFVAKFAPFKGITEASINSVLSRDRYSPTFRRNALLPSSGLKIKPSK
jgi:hypothetical protein